MDLIELRQLLVATELAPEDVGPEWSDLEQYYQAHAYGTGGSLTQPTYTGEMSEYLQEAYAILFGGATAHEVTGEPVYVDAEPQFLNDEGDVAPVEEVTEPVEEVTPPVDVAATETTEPVIESVTEPVAETPTPVIEQPTPTTSAKKKR